MQELSNQRKKILNIFGGLFAISWGGFWIYCFYYAPRSAVEEAGRIYELNFHGTGLFLTRAEYFTLYGIPIVFALIGVVSAILLRLGRRARQGL